MTGTGKRLSMALVASALTLGVMLQLGNSGGDEAAQGGSAAAGIFARAGAGHFADAGGANAFPPAGMPASPAIGRAAAPADVGIQKLDVARWQSRGGDPLLNADLVRIFEQLIGNRSAAPDHELALRVPSAHVEQAQALFERYSRYREALAGVERAGIGETQAEILESVVASRREVQQQFFSEAEIAELFGEDYRYDAFTIERLRLKERADLTLPQKEAMLEQLTVAMLSTEQREARRSALLPVKVMQQNAVLEKNLATPEQRLEARSAAFGAGAASRMAEVDRQEADWQRRIAELAQAEPALQPQLRATLFTSAEQRRLDGALALHRARQARGG